ncbi:putative transcription factor MADS-type1 family [Helianthus anomalus]
MEGKMNPINIPNSLQEKTTFLHKLRMPRKSEGRKKIEMVKIENPSNLAVAFTKRRFGILKKASELCTLCGAQLAVIVFAPNQEKVYSFGSPSVEAIINRFLQQSPDPQSSRASQFIDILRNANIQDLNNQLTNKLEQLEAEKNAAKELQKIREENQQNNWWDKPIEEMDLAELEQLKVAMTAIKEFAERHAEGRTT